MTKEELLKHQPTQHFKMKGDLLIVRTITHDFNGFKIDPKIQYVCRWYAAFGKWLIEPQHQQIQTKPLRKIISIKRK